MLAKSFLFPPMKNNKKKKNKEKKASKGRMVEDPCKADEGVHKTCANPRALIQILYLSNPLCPRRIEVNHFLLFFILLI